MIETARLILRPFREGESDLLVAINNEPEVLEWMTEWTLEDGISRVARYNQSSFDNGFGRMAAVRKSDGALLGSIGIMPAHESLPIAGQPEVGWRLTRAAWGQGYAVEGAHAALQNGFAKQGLTYVLATINAGNTRSQATASRLGMVRAPEFDFEHSEYPPGHRFRETIVFRIDRP
jgi:RimJ/RimL family protein N-acetyltransferase